MRSVVVVLPASMCAMIPMLRVLARSALLAIFFPSLLSSRGLAGWRVSRLPAVVGECLVGFGHLVHVFATLDAGTEAVARVEQFVHQAVGHGLLTALTRVGDQPTE